MPRKSHKARITIYRQPKKLKASFSNPETPKSVSKLDAREEVSGTKFQALPPLGLARRFTERELNTSGTPAEIEWLYQHPVLWYRALLQMRTDVQTHIRKTKLELDSQKTFTNGAAPQSYMDLKAKISARLLKHWHFLRLVTKRMENVTTLLGDDLPVTNADYRRTLLELAQLIDDDEIQAAKDMALNIAERLPAQKAQRKLPSTQA